MTLAEILPEGDCPNDRGSQPNKKNASYLSLDRIVELYPYVRQQNWTTGDITLFFSKGFLKGILKNGRLLITKESLNNLIEVHENQNIK